MAQAEGTSSSPSVAWEDVCSSPSASAQVFCKHQQTRLISGPAQPALLPASYLRQKSHDPPGTLEVNAITVPVFDYGETEAQPPTTRKEHIYPGRTPESTEPQSPMFSPLLSAPSFEDESKNGSFSFAWRLPSHLHWKDKVQALRSSEADARRGPLIATSPLQNPIHEE